MARGKKQAEPLAPSTSPGISGWCLSSVNDHRNCKYGPCSCGCHRVTAT